jgi:hypothetical protein
VASACACIAWLSSRHAFAASARAIEVDRDQVVADEA